MWIGWSTGHGNHWRWYHCQISSSWDVIKLWLMMVVELVVSPVVLEGCWCKMCGVTCLSLPKCYDQGCTWAFDHMFMNVSGKKSKWMIPQSNSRSELVLNNPLELIYKTMIFRCVEMMPAELMVSRKKSSHWLRCTAGHCIHPALTLDHCCVPWLVELEWLL